MMTSAACADDVSHQPSLFTGKERDSESGNDYFLARYYSSAMGRFLSPDWRVAPVSVNCSDHDEGAPGPSLLGTGEGQVAQSQSVKMCAERKEAVPRSSRFCDEAGVRR
jgi:RHS repeat-associated protein